MGLRWGWGFCRKLGGLGSVVDGRGGFGGMQASKGDTGHWNIA